MRISVLIATHNNRLTISECLISIIENLTADDEIVIVNDASTDNTSELLSDFYVYSQKVLGPSVKIISNPIRIGLASSLNIGLTLCSGSYIARMDADDICLKSRFSNQLDFLANNIDIDAICNTSYSFKRDSALACIRILSSNRYCRSDQSRSLKLGRMLLRNEVCHPTIMAKRHFFKNCRYNGLYLRAQDYKLWLDALQKGSVMYRNNVSVIMYRQANTNKKLLLQTFFAIKARLSLISKVSPMNICLLLVGCLNDALVWVYYVSKNGL